MIELKLNPTLKELRWFAGLQIIFFTVVAWVVAQKRSSFDVSQIIVCVSVVVGIIGLLTPAAIRWVYVTWMVACFPIGWVMSNVVAGIVYYAVITPIGLSMRLVGRDPLRRSLDPNATTYWVEHKATTDTNRYFRQF